VTVIGGIILIIVGVLVWIGTMSVAHGLAAFMVIIGVLLALYYVGGPYWRRGGTP
jgi:hypothetical protein